MDPNGHFSLPSHLSDGPKLEDDPQGRGFW
jgi:hypothetical protein